VAISFTKLAIKKEENMIIMSIKRIISSLPHKKKINRFLSDDEKEYNKILSKKRIIVDILSVD